MIENIYTAILSICGGLVRGHPSDTKICGCSNHLYKIVQYSRTYLSMGSKFVGTEGRLYWSLLQVSGTELPKSRNFLSEKSTTSIFCSNT